MELIIIGAVVIVIGFLLSRGKSKKSSVEDKSSPHRGGDNNIKNREK